ncbi:FMN-binding protein [Actinoplanes sp. LDG1-06]|uniref:FMN-binding protein n=1 Tax=Paractinoplanes ovalisporus TaxID=2810368 RepID=A0ABS2A8X4_9ACTN|nr:FMN-binding protein [Actinoplanes ovalisporus]MBM2616289.1 FMN-binding protein [Actinoplanes ovalisporus]
MRRITFWLFSTVAALVLLLSYRTSTGAGGGTSGPVAVATTPATTPPPASKSPSGRATTRTYTGGTASTEWGDVQVTITVTAGRIASVRVPVFSDDNPHDQEINAYALPALVQETLRAQSADIDAVSGATVTSDGYRRSLQSALDAAHLR